MGTNFLPWITGVLFSIVHPFYISMTEINHNATEKTLEVSVRIFTDDFEKTLSKNCNCKVQLLNAADKAGTNKLVDNYIVKHLQLKINGQPATLRFAGYQPEEGSIWSYFEVQNITSIKKLDITNTLLHDYNEQQINMLHIKANGKEHTDKLDYPNSAYSINW